MTPRAAVRMGCRTRLANRAVYYVGDDRDPVLQRRAVAAEIGRELPGFDAVEYPDWEALLQRWWRDAPRTLPLLLDEFPSVVAVSPELPSLLQKHFDRSPACWSCVDPRSG